MAASLTENSLIQDWTCTRIKKDQIHFEWRIKNIKNSSLRNGEYIRSPVFPTDKSTETWELELYPRGDEEIDNKYLSIYLNPVSKKMLNIEVNFEISLIQSNLLIKEENTTYNFTSRDGYGFPTFVPREKLFNSSNNDDAIIIQCKIDILGSRVTSCNSTCPRQEISLSSGTTRLNHDFQEVFKNPQFTDFTIIAENQKFETHKVILAGRSSVFSAMFEHKNFDENQNNQLAIEDIKPDVVKAMLEYIYTDEVSDVNKFAKELLVAAEKYDLQGLKNLCAGEIFKTLDKENAAEILGFTDLYNADELKKYVMSYIVEHSSDIVNSPGYKSADINSSALKEIITMMSQREKNDKKLTGLLQCDLHNIINI